MLTFTLTGPCRIHTQEAVTYEQATASLCLPLPPSTSLFLPLPPTALSQGWPRLPQLVLVGDHKQLSATVISGLAQQHGYGRSLFERLQRLGFPMNLLEVQYRMHPEISSFPRKEFYEERVRFSEGSFS